jgi:hypothetical protein
VQREGRDVLQSAAFFDKYDHSRTYFSCLLCNVNRVVRKIQV